MHNIQDNIGEIIEMAWCDKISFDNIRAITGLSEHNVIQIMRQNLKPTSFRLWRKRVAGRTAKQTKEVKGNKRDNTPNDTE